MGQQQIASSFRTSPPGVTGIPALAWNVLDLYEATSNWTSGASLIDDVSIQPPLGQAWSIAAWTVRCVGLLEVPLSGTPSYGKLGRLIGGLVRGAAPTPFSAVGLPYANPLVPLPIDTTGLAVIWDGDSDPAFPISTSAPGTLQPVMFANNLSSPIVVQSGDRVQIGLWLTPSLAQNVAPGVINATYTITVDDGQQTQAGWT